jgi:hypothetical protein
MRRAGPERSAEKKTRRYRRLRPDPPERPIIKQCFPRMRGGETPSNYTGRMGNWYWVGVFAGLGVALGIAAAAGLAGRRWALLAPLLAAAIAVALGLALAGVGEAVGGGAGGILGAAGALQLVGGALGRGGTRMATALLVVIGAAFVAAFSFVPVLGYVEALAVPALGMRLRRRAGKRYAGLRTLARD